MREDINCDCRELAERYLKDAELDDEQIEMLDKLGYFTAPASRGHHLACPGGLMRHSINVTNLMVELQVPVTYRRSFYRIGMLHDLVKCLCYRAMNGAAQDGKPRYEYVQPGYPGHGIASVLYARDMGIDLTPEETSAIIWHMGLFGLGEKELKEYHAALKFFGPTMILTHAADHLASVYEEKAEDEEKGQQA